MVKGQQKISVTGDFNVNFIQENIQSKFGFNDHDVHLQILDNDVGEVKITKAFVSADSQEIPRTTACTPSTSPIVNKSTESFNACTSPLPTCKSINLSSPSRHLSGVEIIGSEVPTTKKKKKITRKQWPITCHFPSASTTLALYIKIERKEPLEKSEIDCWIQFLSVTQFEATYQQKKKIDWSKKRGTDHKDVTDREYVVRRFRFGG
ncbi:unnamed protein product [Mytilus coruscus]|uniref:Uncharacterized protein n=1 Tax=Mytilus coruscus TaxID=42192 RepID=A0A6J8CSD4_MYTCO|nr:unnamed protein product [Mytilus coruscus]